jgi:hypothetical protein
VSLGNLGICLATIPYAYFSTHFRGSLPGEEGDEVEVPVSQPSPMGNPEEDEVIGTTTRFNILSYPLFTIDGAVEDTYDSSDPSNSGSGSPSSFNPRPWTTLPSPLEKPIHDSSCSLVIPRSIPQQSVVPIYPCTPPSPHCNYDPLPKEGHRPTGHLPGYAYRGQNHEYLGHLHENVRPFIKQEYVEDNHYW